MCSIQSISLISGGAVLRVTTVSHLRLDVLGLLFGLVNSSRGDGEVLSVLNGTQTKGTKCQFCVCALWRTKPLSENPCEDSFALFPLMLSETLNSGLQVDHSCPPFPQNHDVFCSAARLAVHRKRFAHAAQTAFLMFAQLEGKREAPFV